MGERSRRPFKRALIKTGMSELLIFGSQEPDVHYTERRAAYVVVISGNLVATVRSGEKYFLPGGGARAGEAPEETVVREAREELAQGISGLRLVCEAIQYFYSAMDDRHYKMHATIFAGQFTDGLCEDTGEHERVWLPVAEVERACFHECHAWAVRRCITQLQSDSKPEEI
jgi:8-oxo-dGTP diphosphatase